MKYDLPKGQRIKKGFLWITCFDKTMWYCDDCNKWYDGVVTCPHPYSDSKRCGSVRAFRRHLRKHPELKGITMTLCHKEYMITNAGKKMPIDVMAVGS